jgi:hypothetical protein
MTDKTQVVTFTPEERAILDGTSTVKVEETDGGATGGAADGAGAEDSPENPAPEAKPDGADAGKADGDNAGDDDGDDEEVLDVVNAEGEKTPRRMVHYGALMKERAAKAKAKGEVEQLRQQVAYLSGLSQNVQQPKPQPQTQQPVTQELSETPPDKTKEPEKYLNWLEAVAQETVRMRRQSVQQTEQQTQFQQINQTVFEHEQAFINGDTSAEIEPHPDFHDAVKFLQDKHKAELKEAGYEPHEVQQIMAARAQSVALKALQKGLSPAERVYSLAKLNGYKKPAPPKETEAEKITRQATSQAKAGKTISSLPGGESKGGLTAESLANMDPAQFKKLWDSGEAKALMGWKD